MLDRGVDEWAEEFVKSSLISAPRKGTNPYTIKSLIFVMPDGGVQIQKIMGQTNVNKLRERLKVAYKEAKKKESDLKAKEIQLKFYNEEERQRYNQCIRGLGSGSNETMKEIAAQINRTGINNQHVFFSGVADEEKAALMKTLDPYRITRLEWEGPLAKPITAQPSTTKAPASTKVTADETAAMSLGTAEAKYREFSDALTRLQPTNHFINHKDYEGLSLGQQQEIIGLASLNEKTLRVTIYNAPDELVGNILPNIHLTSKGVKEASKDLKHLKNNLSLSKVNNPLAQGDFDDFKEEVIFFKFTTDEAGVAAVGLLYTQSDNKIAFMQKYDLKKEGGFFVAFNQFLNNIVQRFEEAMIIEIAA